MRLTAPTDARDPAWLALRLELWPDGDASEHMHFMADALVRGHFVRLACDGSGTAVGFVEASRHVDYVNGTESSPVAFLEGLYVAPAFRRRGVARTLVGEVERWALAHACSELASDSRLDNPAAHAAHRALGFEETERVA